MKKIKYLLIIFICILFTGCTGDYNLTFNEDLTIDEELNVKIEANNDDVYERTYKLFQDQNIDEDKYNIVIIDDKLNIEYKEKYLSFNDYYLNSNLRKMLFEEINFTKDNKGMVIDTKSNLKLNDKDSLEIINSYDIDDFNINIINPFTVNKNNADKVKDNTYTWTLNKDDTYKNINMEFLYKNDRVHNYAVLITLSIAALFIIGYITFNLIRNKRI